MDPEMDHTGDGMRFMLTDVKLVPAEFNCCWTEHSERAVLNTWAATIGCCKDERDKLGRWQADQSDDYLRSSRATVFSIQSKVVHAIVSGDH
eukprot:5199831-Karenia_brevis.AAC.1